MIRWLSASACGLAACAPADDTPWPFGDASPVGGSEVPTTESGTWDPEGPGAVAVLTGPEALAGAPGRVVPLGPQGCGQTVTALGDLDGDGAPDLAAGCADDLLRVLSGAGLLRGADDDLATVHVPRLEGWAAPAALGDLDGDGVNELGLPPLNATRRDWGLVVSGAALAGELWAVEVARHLDGGGASWASQRGSLPAGDVDGDGVGDVAHLAEDGGETHLVVTSGAAVAATAAGETLDVWAAPLVARTDPGLSGSLHVSGVHPLGDVDGDGLHDLGLTTLVVADGSDPAPVVRLWLSASAAPTGGIQDLPALGVPAGAAAEAWASGVVSVGDLDGDGRSDLAIAAHTTEGWAAVLVVPGADLPGSGTHDGTAYVLAEVSADALVACDLDGDGAVELVTAGGIWAGGDLPYGPRAPIARGVAGVCLGDLDGDGAEDLAAGDPASEAR